MRKIAFSGFILSDAENLTAAEVLKLLQGYGTVQTIFQSEVEVVNTAAMDLPNTAWIYISSDDSEGYRLVDGPKDSDGRELTEAEVIQLQKTAVCAEFHAEYPRADRYGAPSYATDETFAEGIVGEHGFRVPLEGFEVHANDCGDDTCEKLWLKLALPA